MDQGRDAAYSDARETGVPRVPLDVGDDRPRPFRRFFAKTADATVASFLTMLVFYLLGARFGGDWGSALVLSIISLLVWAVIEVALLSRFGTTVGRRLYRLRLTQESGAPLTRDHIVWRTIRVLVFGLGFGLPVITLIAQLAAYLQLNASGRTSWDRKGGLRVEARPMTVPRWLLALAATFAIMVAAVGIPIPV